MRKRSGPWAMLAWCTHLVLVLLVSVTVLLSAGRLMTSLVAGYHDEIEQELGTLLGTAVVIDEITGEWFRYGPIINVSGLHILNPDNQDAGHVIASLFIKPDLGASLLNRSLIIDQVIVEEPEFRLTENAEGKWSLAGLAAGEGDADYTDAIVDFLLSTGRLQIVEAGLSLFWSDGRELELDNIFVDLGNQDSLHEALIQARIAGQPSPFQMMATINGDPRSRYDASLYFHGTDIEVADISGISGFALDMASFSGDLWLTVQDSQLFDVQAHINDLHLDGAGTQDSPINVVDLDNASLDLTLRHSTSEQWQVWLDNVEFDWFTRPWSGGGIYVSLEEQEDAQPLAINAASIDLAMVTDVIDDILVLPERAATALADLAPAGRLENLVVNTDLSGNYDDGFLLQGNLADVAVGAWQGAPSGSGIQGYVQANASNGFVELDSSDFEIHLPRLFDDSWQYTSANSRVHWSIQPDQLRVYSSVIDVSNDFIHGHVQFDLYNHRNSNDELESELTLMIGLIYVDASYKSLYLPKLAGIRTTMEWLDEALLDGRVSNSGFVSRTSTLGNAPVNSGTVLSFYEVADGRLKFQPQWPELTGIDAFILQENNNVDVTATSAAIEGINLGSTTATVRPAEEGGMWLSLQGSASTRTDLGMAFLRNTPVRNNIGDFIDDWRGEGNIDVDINLGIPLNNPERRTDVMVNVVSNMSTLTIPAYSLAIEQLRGRVVYDSDTGLSANALSGQLFDFPIAATIEAMTGTDAGGNRIITGTRVVGSGRASNTALQAWEGQPGFVRDVLNFASGEIDYLAEVTIPNAGSIAAGGEGNSLRLSSELLGLSLDLPFPFRKSVENIRPLEVLIDFDDNGQWISARFDNRVGANLKINEDEFAGGNVLFGPDITDMTFGPVEPASEKLMFSGYLDRFDYADWDDTATRFTESSAGQGDNRLEDLVGLVDVNVGRLNVMDQDLENVRTRVQRTGELADDSEAGTADADSWLVFMENSLLSGSFRFPDDEARPWLIDLDYLRFPETEEPEAGEAPAEEVDILADVNPATLPDLDFVTRELTVGDKHLGAWDFRLRTTGNSATISDLRMTTPDARIRDLTGESGANLDWRFTDGMHTSSFTGLFSAGDLAQVLPGWGYDANVESENAAFVSNLQWSGSPAAFSLKKAVGNVDLAINNGRFVDVDSGTSRLFGAFSFDSLVRRLQLDFSDLYEKGLAYDEIRGNLDFNQGIVATQEDLVIEGPSSRITIDGRINLLNETIDADMLVNVPLGQNLSVLAGILGAWPIAVSTFLASRIFQDQMDDFTTVLYRLEGPWENPTSGFEPTEEILEEVEAVQAETAEDSADTP